jgi:hypothetical protein
LENLTLDLTNPIKLSKSKVQTTKISKPLPTKNTKKRKIDEIQEEDEMEIEGEPKRMKITEDDDDDEKLWMINFDQFIRKFRHEEIINLVLKRINPTCAIIIAKIIELVAGSEKTKNDLVSRKEFL